jgi:hypothetical protein
MTAAQDAAELLTMTGLGVPAYRWDTARVARVALEHARWEGTVSANVLRARLPERAHPLIPGALTALRMVGLIVTAEVVMPSTSARARGSLVRSYQLTDDGAVLAAELDPVPVHKNNSVQRLHLEAVT